MGILIVKVGSTATHRDGDVISAISDRRIQQVQLEHACHQDRCRRSPDTFLPLWSRPYVYQLSTHRYQFIRDGNEVHRFDQQTQRVDTFSGVPRIVDGQLQSIQVEEFLLRRLAHPRHRIYGEPGRQVWFGGEQDYSWGALTQVQIMLELSVVHHWPSGRLDVRHHLVLPVDWLEDSDAEALEGTWVNWRRLFGSRMRERIEDRSRAVELQGFASFPLSVVECGYQHSLLCGVA